MDVLVNNVGGLVPAGPTRLSEEEWHFEINLTSIFSDLQVRDPGHWEEKGGGATVNIASMSGIRFTGASAVAYAASKAGVIQFGRVVTVEYAKKGIRVNSVLPGQLHTPLVEVVLTRSQSGGDVEASLKRRQARIPLPLMGDGRDTAYAALFLASDEAHFVTGAEIVVDGGMSAWCG